MSGSASATHTLTPISGHSNNHDTLHNNTISHSILMDHIEDRLYRYRAKRLRFLINGDKLFTGINYALNTERIRSFDALLNDLTCSLSMDHLKLCKGVRYIFSIDGIMVVNLTDFQDGQTYVCSSTDTFISIEYRISNGMLNWLVRNSACISSDERAIKAKRQRALYSLAPNSNRLQHLRQPSPSPRKHNQQTNSNASHNNISNGHVHPRIDNSPNQPQNQNSARINRFSGGKTPATQTKLTHNRESESSHLETSASSGRSPNLNSNRRPVNSSYVARNRAPQKATTPVSTNVKPICKASPKQQTPKKSLSAAQQQQNLDIIADSFGAEVTAKYDVGRPIGDGHFSVVYCCMNKATQEFCALKLIDKLKCKGRDDMIYNEVKILKRLNHPNIVKLMEEFDYSEQLYLVLELVQDGDLFDAISTVTKFSESHVATMIHNLSSALSYLHEQGIVHRDIKPENLLISVQEDGSQSVKLADFGLAVELGDSPLYSVCGTAFYVSPEMLNETGYDFKVDIWSTGVICFILLCGYPPFTSENESNQDELFDAILAGDFQFALPYWSKISQHAKNLIRCMLTVDPDKRYTAEQVFKHPWTMGTSSNFEGLNPMNMSRRIALNHGVGI